MRPVSDQPSVAITSPAADATVQGIVPVEITATPSPATSPVQSADLYVDGTYVTSDQEAPWGASSGTPEVFRTRRTPSKFS